MSRLSFASVALGLAIAAGCHAGRSPVNQGSDTVDTPARGATAAAGSSVRTPALTLGDAARAACVSMAEILRNSAAAAGIGADTITSPRDTVATLGDTVEDAACILHWHDSASRGMPLQDIFTRLEKSGWQQRLGLLSADGPGSEAVAYSRNGAACAVMGEEDAEDDSDSTYVPKPGFDIQVTCSRDRPDPH